MRSSPAVVYSTGHALNERMSRVLSTGFNAQKRPACSRTLQGDEVVFVPIPPRNDALAIVYGILRGTGEILQECERYRIDYLYCDHSYFDRTRSDTRQWGPSSEIPGYFRLVPNDRYFRFQGDKPADRWRQLNLELKEWRKPRSGTYILVVPLSRFVAAYRGMDSTAWMDRTINEIRKYTNRRIVVKQKDSEVPLASALEDAHALVTLESNAAVEAAINGVPIFTGVSAAAAPMAHFDIAVIDNPPKLEREQHLYNLAYQQFSAREINAGVARDILFNGDAAGAESGMLRRPTPTPETPPASVTAMKVSER